MEISLSGTPVRRNFNAQSTPLNREGDRERSPGPLSTPELPSVHQAARQRMARAAAAEIVEQASEPSSNDSTPNRKNKHIQPRTPTPFKDALAKLERKNGAMKIEVRFTSKFKIR